MNPNNPPACPIAQRVANRITQRAETGLKKYGINCTRQDLNLADWLQHLQDELMDAAVYVERLKGEIAPKNKSLRDEIALKALMAILTCDVDFADAKTAEARVKKAYEHADAMLAARKEGQV